MEVVSHDRPVGRTGRPDGKERYVTTEQGQEVAEDAAAQEASQRLAELVSSETVDRLLADAQASGTPFGRSGRAVEPDE